MTESISIRRLLVVLGVLTALAVQAQPSPPASSRLSDDQLLDLVQRQTFKYFQTFAHPVSGLTQEQERFPERCAIGGSGFGVMSYIVAVKRGFITREQAATHLLKLTRFLRDNATRYHGAWPHWVQGGTGATLKFSPTDDGGDIVETAFLMQGLLTARAAFSDHNPVESELRNIITQLWEGVEWDWYANGTDTVFWHWSPNHAFEKGLKVTGYNETLIVYLLGIASPTHPLPITA